MAENTKERILSAAFSFYRTPCFTEISLSQIAEKVGITKAAIFKHFKNKDALKDAMKDKMYGDVAVVLKEMQQMYANIKDEEALPTVITFIAEHPEYLNYMLMTLGEFTEDSFYLQMKNYGVSILDKIYDDNGGVKNLSEYIKSVFVSTTMLVFIMFREKIAGGFIALDLPVSNIGDFAKRLSDLISHGVRGNDARITMLRLAEIDSVCKESMVDLKAADRVLLAIAKVISDFGIAGITVDKVAKELGLAKSSLYTWFSNKNDMIKTLIKEEFEQLYEIIVKNMQKMNTSGERLYVMLQTVLAYLMHRPELLDVLKWIQMSDEIRSDKEAWNKEHEIEKFLKAQDIFNSLPDLGIAKNDVDAVFNLSTWWFFALPVILFVHGRAHKFELPILQAAMKDMYFMVQYGANAAAEM